MSASLKRDGSAASYAALMKKMTEIKKKGKPSSLLLKVAILGIADLLCIMILIWLLTRLPEKAGELKNLRSLQRKASVENAAVIEKEIMLSQVKTDKLAALFPDEAGLINFVKEIDRLKSGGIATHFSFASNKVVKDKTGVLGLPLLIEFRGSWSEVDTALQKVQELPFLIRAVNVEVRQLPESEFINLRYGGVLYVDESFYKD